MRTIVVMVVYLYTSRLVLKILGAEDFGIYYVVGDLAVFFSSLSGALSNSTSRFLAYELGKGDEYKLKRIFQTSFAIHSIFAGIILLLTETIGLWLLNNILSIPSSRLFAANIIYQFAILGSIVSIIQIPLSASIIAHEQMKAFAYLSLLEAVLKMVVAYLLSISGYDRLISYALLYFIAHITISMFHYIYCSRRYTECSFVFRIDKDMFKEMLSYTGWTTIGSISWLLKLQGLSLLLNTFFGPLINASRGIAYQVESAITRFSQSFTTALTPQIVKSHACQDLDHMFSLTCTGAKVSYYLLLILAVPIIFETDYILSAWLTTVPKHTALFTQLVLINSLFESFIYAIGASIQATGRVKWYQIIVGGINLLNLPLSYICLKYIPEPAMVFIIMIMLTGAALAGRLIILKQVINFPIRRFFSEVLMGVSLATVVVVGLVVLVKDSLPPGAVRFSSVLVVTFITLPLVIFAIGLNKREKNYIRLLIKYNFRKTCLHL